MWDNHDRAYFERPEYYLNKIFIGFSYTQNCDYLRGMKS
jgi:hypothetical protein